MTLKQQLARIVKLAGTDPRWQGLVAALTEKCPSRYHHPSFDRWSREYYEAQSCEFCGGTGRVLRSWEDQPQGALAGTLLLWCNSQPQTVLIQQLGKELEGCFNLKAPYCNEQAATVVLGALRKEATHATE